MGVLGVANSIEMLKSFTNLLNGTDPITGSQETIMTTFLHGENSLLFLSFLIL